MVRDLPNEIVLAQASVGITGRDAEEVLGAVGVALLSHPE
jgi:hypothetical protein